MWRCSSSASAGSALASRPSSCAAAVEPLPSATSTPRRDADRRTAAHSVPCAGPRRRAATTANGSRVSLSPPSPPGAARAALSCSAPSRSAGCTLVPARSVRRRSAPIASPSPRAARSIMRYAGPYCRPERANHAYNAATSTTDAQRAHAPAGASAASHAAAGAAAPVQCTRGVSSASAAVGSPLRTSKRPSSFSTHSTHISLSSALSSSTSGCTKKTSRSAAPALRRSWAAQHAARAISRYAAPGKTTRPRTMWSATRAWRAPAVGERTPTTVAQPPADGTVRCASGWVGSRHGYARR